MNNINDYDADAERIAEVLFTSARGRIVDVDTFEEYWGEYMGKTTSKQERLFKPEVFRKMKDAHPKISGERLFTSADGKDLRRDKKETAQEVTTDKEEYKRKGASRVDLEGYDTKEKYDTYGVVKKQVVRVRKDSYNYKGQTRTVYRDSRGRFASRLK